MTLRAPLRLRVHGAAPPPPSGFTGFTVVASKQAEFSIADPTATSTYYNPGVGNPAVSTADYYQKNGLLNFHPKDLRTMGSAGAAVVATNGGLPYVWICSADHPVFSAKWRGGEQFSMGFSAEPWVFPETLTTIIPTYNDFFVPLWPSGNPNGTLNCYEAPMLFYDDADVTTPFHLFAEAGPGNRTVLWKSSDLFNWTVFDISHNNDITSGKFTSFQRIFRKLGPGSYWCWGLLPSGNTTAIADGVWTSTDGLYWTTDFVARYGHGGGSHVNPDSLGRELKMFELVDVGESVLYGIGREDTLEGGAAKFQYCSIVPIDPVTYGTVDAIPRFRFKSGFSDNAYPGPTYLQGFGSYVEHGLIYAYPTYGFPSDVNTGARADQRGGAPYNGPTNGVPPGTGGGGLVQQFMDCYVIRYNDGLARLGPPVGVVGACADGAVSIGWQNALPQETYKVERGTTSAVQDTLVADVTGISVVDAPQTEYYGFIATRCDGCWHGDIDTVNTQFNCRSVHKVRASVPQFKIRVPNVGVITGIEKGPTHATLSTTATVSVGVEYPPGTFTRVLFSGGVNGTVPTGTQLESDWIPRTLVDGTELRIWTYLRCPAGTIHTATQSNPPKIAGDAINFGTSLPDLSMGGAIVDNAANLMYFPTAIAGMTSEPSVIMPGDSTTYGINCLPNSAGDKGLSASIGPTYAYANIAVPGERIEGYNSSSVQRRSLYPLATTVLTNFGLNDLYADGVSATVTRARMAVLANQVPANVALWLCTLTPISGTTDVPACTTQVGQVFSSAGPPLIDIGPNGVQKVDYNESLRTGAFQPGPSFAGYVELADVMEISRNGMKWKTSPHLSDDCRHWNTLSANTTLPASGVIPLASFDAPANGRQWYKVTTMDEGVRRGARTVSVYVSNSSAFVNRHMERVLADGGNEGTCNLPFLRRMDAMLDTVGIRNLLQLFTHAGFGVKNSSSPIKVYDLGTTRLPRSKDFKATTANTTYNATGVNGGPAWMNATNTAYGYWGDSREGNTIQRKRQITILVAYERTQTTEDVTFVGTGPVWGNVTDGNKVIALRHTAGATGTIEFSLCDMTARRTATSTAAGLGLRIAVGTYDGTSMLAYANGVVGAAVTSLDPNPNFGQQTNRAGPNTAYIEGSLGGGRLNSNSESRADAGPSPFPRYYPFLANGSIHAYMQRRYNVSPEVRTFTEAQARVNMQAVMVLEGALSAAQIAAVTTELQSAVDW